MSIKYQDLNPTEASFILNKKEYYLRPFDLAARVWAEDAFATKENKSGLMELSELVQDMTSFTAVYKCVWHLLKRKRDFGFFDNFLKAIGDDDNGEHLTTKGIYDAFVKTLGVSEPQIEDMKDELELKKS